MRGILLQYTQTLVAICCPLFEGQLPEDREERSHLCVNRLLWSHTCYNVYRDFWPTLFGAERNISKCASIVLNFRAETIRRP